MRDFVVREDELYVGSYFMDVRLSPRSHGAKPCSLEFYSYAPG